MRDGDSKEPRGETWQVSTATSVKDHTAAAHNEVGVADRVNTLVGEDPGRCHLSSNGREKRLGTDPW
jgi:hypothetical protein